MNVDFSQVPCYYAMCLNDACPKSDNCLRRLAALSAPLTHEYWNIVNPNRTAEGGEACAYFRSAAKVRYARGFIGMLDALPHKMRLTAIHRLNALFNNRTYYRVRKGERLLSPEEQEKLLRVVHQCGATGTLRFDAYVEDFAW